MLKNFKLEEIEIRIISAEQTLELRHQVLWPDKPIEHCMVTGDDAALHFALLIMKNWSVWLLFLLIQTLHASESLLRNLITKDWELAAK